MVVKCRRRRKSRYRFNGKDNEPDAYMDDNAGKSQVQRKQFKSGKQIQQRQAENPKYNKKVPINKMEVQQH